MLFVGGRICKHGGCKLPKNNCRFLWQFAYILLGFVILVTRDDMFTFFQVFLFTSPILIDVAYANDDTKTLWLFRKFFFVINIGIILLCIIGMAGLVSDSGSEFVFNFEVFNTGDIPITKSFFSGMLGLNLIVPLFYFGLSPCQENEGTLTFVFKKVP